MKKNRILFLGLWIIFSWSGAWGQQTEKLITLQVDDVSVLEALKEITRLSDNCVSYKREEIEKEKKKISLELKSVRLRIVVDSVLAGTQLKALVRENEILVVPGRVNSGVVSQILRGRVLDETKKPLPGVTVRLEGTIAGTATDRNGEFVMNLPVTDGTLIFSSVGYEASKQYFRKDQPFMVVTLKESVADLDEVKVVGYGTTTRREMTGAVSTVKGEDLEGIPSPNIATLLQGRVAGMDITNISGAPGGGGTAITIRGYNSLDIELERRFSNPLWVVDGVPLNSFTSPVTGTNLLADINPDMIESIEVLKDASSAAIYGSRAANGVIIVTTKK